MKLPSRIAVTLTTAITGLMALSAETNMSHTAHQLCLIGGALILGLVVHPTETGSLPATEPRPTPLPIDGSNVTPTPPV